MTTMNTVVGFDEPNIAKVRTNFQSRSSESDESVGTPVASPIKNMLLNELLNFAIEEENLGIQQKQQQQKSRRRKTLSNLSEETSHATLNSNVGEQEQTQTVFSRSFSEPIPIPVCDLQLRYVCLVVVFRSRFYPHCIKRGELFYIFIFWFFCAHWTFPPSSYFI